METENCTFKPEISSRAKKIFERKRISDNVYERNYLEEFDRMRKKDEKIRTEIIKGRMQQPNITPLASTMPRSEPIGDRLYNLAIKSIHEKEQKRVSTQQPGIFTLDMLLTFTNNSTEVC